VSSKLMGSNVFLKKKVLLHFCKVASGARAEGRVGFSFKDFVIQPKW